MFMYHICVSLSRHRWCESGKVFTGDFNGDQRWDLLCYVQSTGEICVRFNSNIFGCKVRIEANPVETVMRPMVELLFP